MAELMKKSDKLFRGLHKGQLIEGKVTKLTPAEILINIDGKTEAVVLEKDRRILKTLLSTLHLGDTVQVSVLSPESDMGYPIVSLRRFIDTFIWKQFEDLYQANKPLEATIAEITKGGYLIDTGYGITGFLPNSQLQSKSEEGADLQDQSVGARIKVYILELQKPAKKIVFSKRPVVTKEQFDEAVKGIKVGQKISAIVTNITPFGAFATLQIPGKTASVDGLVHISEVAWEKVETVSDIFTPGQKIETVVLGIDQNAKRVDLSLKRTLEDPFEKTAQKFAVDTKLKGTVARISSQGVVLSLEGDNAGVEVLMKKEKIPPTVTYKEGQEVMVTVSAIEKGKRRILVLPVLTEKPMGYR